MSDSAGSGSLEASFVVATQLAFERVSMAECIMGSHTSSMFGITNIFWGKKKTVSQELKKQKQNLKKHLEMVLKPSQILNIGAGLQTATRIA